jgi:serine/threonine-protein kinase
MTSVPETAPKQGTILSGKYRIDGVLGVGGMGYVLAATHLQLRERVAIKMLLPERAKQADTVARFLREGRAAVRIRSEHVARVLDVDSDGDAPYIVMEYLEGSDLADVLHRNKSLRPEVAVDYLLEACEALAEAHALELVHRDLKPANLFLVRLPGGRTSVKVLDFGISKSTAADDGDAAMTKTTSTVGTPLYMSPEQLRSSKNVDVRADIWSLGVILFELVAGRPPFRAASIAELGAKVLTTEAPDLRTVVPDAPPALAEAVRTCLRRDPRQRFASVADLARALAPFGTASAAISAARIADVLANAQPSEPKVLPGSLDEARANAFDASTTGSSITDGTWGTITAGVEPVTPANEPPKRRRTLHAAVIGAVAIVGLGGGGLAATWARRGRHIEPVTSAAVSGSPVPEVTLGADAAPPALSGTAIASPPVPTGTTSTRGVQPGRPPARAVAPARSVASQKAATASTEPGPPPPRPSPTGSAGPFLKGRFGDE